MQGKDITKCIVGVGVMAVMGFLAFVIVPSLGSIDTFLQANSKALLAVILLVALPMPAYLLGHGIVENMQKKGH